MAFLGDVIGNEQRIPSQVIRWLCLLRNMLLVSAFRNLDRKDVVKRSTRRWRSLVGLLEMSNIFLLKLYSGYACLKNIGKGVAICLEMSYNTFSA